MASASISISQLECDVGYSRLINIFEAFDVVNIIRPLLAVDIVDIATVFPPHIFVIFLAVVVIVIVIKIAPGGWEGGPAGGLSV